MREADYQAGLKIKIETLLPGCLVTKNDANHIQGLPDLTVFYRDRWAFLEVKASEKSRERPNQRYYIEKWSEHSFAAFIFPENEQEILSALEQHMAVRC
jgi:phosphoribosyl 1,2-cyclic phosphodiesterase